jgi:hypothetical protein
MSRSGCPATTAAARPLPRLDAPAKAADGRLFGRE